jgi:signal transduction histidine kinase
MGMERHPHEEERLRTLESYGIVATLPEATFDNVACMAAEIGDAPIALVTLIDRTTQWNKARFGTDVIEVPKNTSFCARAVASGKPLIVEDASKDPRFANLPSVTGDEHVRFYAGIPVRAANGLPIGTVCIIDRHVRTVSYHQFVALRALAREVEANLEVRRLNATLEKALAGKEQLGRFLAHELNGMVTAVSCAVACLLKDAPLGPDDRRFLRDMDATVRRAALVTRDFLDVALSKDGRLRPHIEVIAPSSLLERIAAEARLLLALDNERLRASFDGHGDVLATDIELVARVVLNFLRNAFKYAPPRSPITLSARRVDNALEIRVSDQGPGIPEREHERIFEAYERLGRGDDPHVRQSTGLGLAFCRVAARALGGQVWVEGNADGGSTFGVRVPDLRALTTLPVQTSVTAPNEDTGGGRLR